MKRRIFRVCLFLLLGAIINVAVAWGLALWSLPDWEGQSPPDGSDLLWANRIGVAPDQVAFVSNRRSCGLQDRTLWRNPFLETSSLAQPVGVKLKARLPVNGLGGDFYAAGDWLTSWEWTGSGGIILSDRRFIPLRVLWPGFAINTVFYAAILWLPVAGLGVIRRIKRGLCAACAYPVGTNPHCTECGKPVNVKTA